MRCSWRLKKKKKRGNTIRYQANAQLYPFWKLLLHFWQTITKIQISIWRVSTTFFPSEPYLGLEEGRWAKAELELQWCNNCIDCVKVTLMVHMMDSHLQTHSVSFKHSWVSVFDISRLDNWDTTGQREPLNFSKEFRLLRSKWKNSKGTDGQHTQYSDAMVTTSGPQRDFVALLIPTGLFWIAETEGDLGATSKVCVFGAPQ